MPLCICYMSLGILWEQDNCHCSVCAHLAILMGGGVGITSVTTTMCALLLSLSRVQDNLMPLSCQGQDWQGGLSLTLVDSLDTLALMNRCVCVCVGGG